MHCATLCSKLTALLCALSDAGDFTNAHSVFHHNPDGVVQNVIDLQFLQNLVELLLQS